MVERVRVIVLDEWMFGPHTFFILIKPGKLTVSGPSCHCSLSNVRCSKKNAKTLVSFKGNFWSNTDFCAFISADWTRFIKKN